MVKAILNLWLTEDTSPILLTSKTCLLYWRKAFIKYYLHLFIHLFEESILHCSQALTCPFWVLFSDHLYTLHFCFHQLYCFHIIFLCLRINLKETMTKNNHQKLSFLDTLAEFWLHVYRLLSEHVPGNNGQFPQLPEAVYLYSFMGLKALLRQQVTAVTMSFL